MSHVRGALRLLTASPYTCVTAQVDETLEVVESLLACEFLTLANMQVGGGTLGESLSRQPMCCLWPPPFKAALM